MAGAVTLDARPLGITLFESGGTASRPRCSTRSRMARVRRGGVGAARSRAWGLTRRARTGAAGIPQPSPPAPTPSPRTAQRAERARSAASLICARTPALARDNLAGAERNFRAAMYSATAGYTCANSDLARVLIRLGRPREAVAAVAPALAASSTRRTSISRTPNCMRCSRRRGTPRAPPTVQPRITRWLRVRGPVAIRPSERAPTAPARGSLRSSIDHVPCLSGRYDVLSYHQRG
jgi:hypothetical protein